MNSNLFKKFVRHGVLSRSDVKNELSELRALMRHGFVKKVYQGKWVFYELTANALGLLEHFRVQLCEEAKMRRELYPRRASFYDALLHDLRFLDPSQKEANDFLFLGDWRVTEKPTHSQMMLSQYRYYAQKGHAS